MKLIGVLLGVVAIRGSQEEYIPKMAPVPQDIVELVRQTYQFAVFPQFLPGQVMPHSYTFNNGRFAVNNQTFGIPQLLMVPEGDIAFALSTDQAGLVLDHLFRLLDDTFGYRLMSSNKVISYVSNVVVEFDKSLSEYMASIEKMEKVINTFRPQPTAQPFRIKRFAFGASANPPVLDPLITVENADFLLERRLGHRFEENRYFSSAPMQTNDHIRALEEIEAIARGDAIPPSVP
jgi:hypothetical protein